MLRRLALACALAACAAPAAAQTAAPAPRLLVFITVDQMRPDYFTRWPGQLNGGLARLWNGGAVFTNAHQDHAVTETAPGHASTMSGRFPRSTGIVSNEYGVADPQTRLLTMDGPGASPFRFRGSVLADWLRVKDPRSRALSVSR
jgi:predicted AlkP superfamily pyrophosphatase or phosphodiesterase